MHLRDNPADDEILALVERWIDDLATGDYVAAYGSTAHDPYYGWSPELIRSVIEGYGLPESHPSGTTFTVTPRASAQGGPPQRSVERGSSRPAVIAEVWHDLPLNGEWSDLTATFRVESATGGSRLVLQEIHVFQRPNGALLDHAGNRLIREIDMAPVLASENGGPVIIFFDDFSV